MYCIYSNDLFIIAIIMNFWDFFCFVIVIGTKIFFNFDRLMPSNGPQMKKIVLFYPI